MGWKLEVKPLPFHDERLGERLNFCHFSGDLQGIAVQNSISAEKIYKSIGYKIADRHSKTVIFSYNDAERAVSFAHTVCYKVDHVTSKFSSISQNQ